MNTIHLLTYCFMSLTGLKKKPFVYLGNFPGLAISIVLLTRVIGFTEL